MMELSHNQAFEYLQASMDKQLDSEVRAALDNHLQECLICQEFVALNAQLQEIKVEDWDPSIPLNLLIQETVEIIGRELWKRRFKRRVTTPLVRFAKMGAAIIALMALGWLLAASISRPDSIAWAIQAPFVRSTPTPRRTLAPTFTPSPTSTPKAYSEVIFAGRSEPLGKDPSNIFIQGSYAYVGVQQSLVILEIKSGRQPRIVSKTMLSTDRFGLLGDIYVAEDYAYIANLAEGLLIVDVSNPALPRTVGRVTQLSPQQLEVLARKDNQLFVLTKPICMGSYWPCLNDALPKLVVIDVADPSSPKQVSAYEVPSEDVEVGIGDNYAYLLETRDKVPSGNQRDPGVIRESVLYILDLSNTADLKMVGKFGLSMPFNSMAVSGVHIYLASKQSLMVLDVSEPINPSEIGTYRFDRLWQSPELVVKGGAAYIFESIEGQSNKPGLHVWVIDISKPSNPELITFLDEPGLRPSELTYDIAVKEYEIYVGRGSGRVEIWKFYPPPKNIDLIGRSGHFSGAPYSVFVQGDYAYAGVENQLVILSIADPSNPTILHQSMVSTEDTEPVLDVFVTGNYAYLANWMNGFLVVDVSNPQNPRVLGRSNNEWLGEGADVIFQQVVEVINVSDGYAYITLYTCKSPCMETMHHPSLRIVDVSDPNKPREVGFYGGGDAQTFRTVVEGDYAYLVDEKSHLKVLDVSDKTAPSLINDIPLPEQVYSIAVQGSRLYLTELNRLKILDISNPSAPIVIGSYILVDYWNPKVIIDNGYAFIYDERSYDPAPGFHLEVIGVANPIDPRQAGYYRETQIYSAPTYHDLAVQMDHIFTIGGTGVFSLGGTEERGLQVLEFSP